VRPWFTAFMDSKSRMYLGWRITTAPDHLIIHQAFADMVDRYGIPRAVKFDWGKDFLAKHFVAGSNHPKHRHSKSNANDLPGIFALLGIRFIAVEPYHGQSKNIERSFKQVIDRFAKLWATYCGPAPTKRPERCDRAIAAAKKQLAANGSTELIPTLDQLHKRFTHWIEHDYHQRAHGGQGMHGRSPVRCWNDEVHDRVVRRLPRGKLRFFLMKKKRAKVGRDGIAANDNLYWADELAGDQVGRSVIIRWDPDNVNELFVYDNNDLPLCMAKILSPSSQVTPEKHIKELKHKRKLVKTKIRQAAGAREDLKSFVARTDQRLNYDPDDNDPLEYELPEPPRVVETTFDHPLFDSQDFFADQQKQKRVVNESPLATIEIPKCQKPQDLGLDLADLRIDQEVPDE